MAKKVTTTLVDDFDESSPAETVPFSLLGVDYEIDLSHENLSRLRADLDRYIRAARKVSRGAARPGRRSAQRHAHLQNARVWLRANGHDIGDRGRVPKPWLRKYEMHEASLNGAGQR